MADDSTGRSRNMMGDAIQALAEKHGQMDIRFDDLTLAFGDTGMQVQLRGVITIQMHMRELADEERAAHVAHNVQALKA